MTDAIVIRLAYATDYDRESHGITHRSEFVYRMSGRNTSRDPHRVTVWDNTCRENTPDHPHKYGPDAPGAFGVGKIGPGKYVSPKRTGTDDPVSLTWSRECTVIDNRGTGTGTKGSGQVWAPFNLSVGDTVILAYPDGSQSVPLTIGSTFNDGATLVPVAS